MSLKLPEKRIYVVEHEFWYCGREGKGHHHLFEEIAIECMNKIGPRKKFFAQRWKYLNETVNVMTELLETEISHADVALKFKVSESRARNIIVMALSQVHHVVYYQIGRCYAVMNIKQMRRNSEMCLGILKSYWAESAVKLHRWEREGKQNIYD